MKLVDPMAAEFTDTEPQLYWVCIYGLQVFTLCGGR